MDRFEVMTLLLEVVDRGSLSAAGRALRTPVSTVSRRLSELEARLGTRLLVRTTRKLSLTEAGEAYVEAARRIVEQVDDAERQAAGEFRQPKGELILAAPVMFGRLHVLPVVADFLARFPAIDVQLLLADRVMHLVDDHVDMAVRIGTLASSSTMVATRVGAMGTVACASPALLAQHGRPSTPACLACMPCITVDAPLLAPSWRFHEPDGGRALDVVLRPRLCVTSTDAARAAALRGIGVARLLHYQVAEALSEGTLVRVLEEYEPPAAPVHLVHAARGNMPLKMRRFLDFAAPRLRTALAPYHGAPQA